MLIPVEARYALLTLAREAIGARVRRETPPPVPAGHPWNEPAAVFVTVYVAGELRGCLGRLERQSTLGEIVVHLGAEVAVSDPRFAPLTVTELSDLTVEVSVLSPEEAVSAIDEVVVGRHGLIVEQGHRRGLLLPQVAREHGWDRLTFVEQTCVKAGLPADAWRRGARIFTFEAQVFDEGDRPQPPAA